MLQRHQIILLHEQQLEEHDLRVVKAMSPDLFGLFDKLEYTREEAIDRYFLCF